MRSTLSRSSERQLSVLNTGAYALVIVTAPLLPETKGRVLD